MKRVLWIAAALVATAAASGTEVRTAGAEECTGPFRQCAIGVGAVCSRDPDGQQRMTYWDHPGHVMMFERCVGGIFAAAGQPDPYKTPGASMPRGRRQAGAALTVPRSELLYPLLEP